MAGNPERERETLRRGSEDHAGAGRGRAARWLRSPGWLLAAAWLAVVVGWWEVRIDKPAATKIMMAFLIDQYDIYKPTLLHAKGELRGGHFPLWDPWRGTGIPDLAIAEINIFYPSHLLHLLLDFQLANRINMMLHYWLAFVAMLFLCRTLRLSWPAAAVAGATYAFSGELQWYLHQNTFLIHAAHLPLVMAFTEKLMDTGRRSWVVLLAGGMALEYFAGHPSFTLMAIYMVVLTYAFHAVRLLRAGQYALLWQRTAYFSGAGLLAFLLVAWHFLPWSEALFLSPRAPGQLTIEEANWVRGLLAPQLVGVSVTSAGPLRFPIFNVGYLGIMGVLLLPFAPLHRERSRVLFYGVVAIWFALVAMADVTPVYSFWFHHVPLAGSSRYPAYFFLLVVVGASVLMAFGYDAMLTASRRSRLLSLAALTLVTVPFGLLVDLRERLGNLTLFGYEAFYVIHLSQVFALVGTLVLWSLAILRGSSLRRAALVIPVLVAADLTYSFSNDLPTVTTDPDFFSAPPDLAGKLRELQSDGLFRTHLHREYDISRVAPEGPVKFPQSIGLQEKIFTISFYEFLFPRRYAEYYAYMERGPGLRLGIEQRRDPVPSGLTIMPSVPQGRFRLDPSLSAIRLLDLMSVRWIVVARGDRFVTDGVPTDRYPVVSMTKDYTILENPRAVPRAFVVPGVEVCRDAQRVFERLTQPDFDPLRAAVVEAPIPGLDGAAARDFHGAARIAEYEPESVTIETQASAPALLVLTDQFFPGWQAEVDGVRAEIRRANYIFRGVAVPAGSHLVRFRYRPRRYWYGGGLTLAALVSIPIWLRRVDSREGGR